MSFNKSNNQIKILTKDRDQLREEVLDWMRKYNDLQEDSLKDYQEMSNDKRFIIKLLTDLSEMRKDWIREHSEEFEDGTDIVTPFDHFFYAGYRK